jgi:hypothetical protein
MSYDISITRNYCGWEWCHYCGERFAIIDPDTGTCGPTCNAKLYTGLYHLQVFQEKKNTNKKLLKWLKQHPKIKNKYETNEILTNSIVKILKNITSKYDKVYMTSLFNSWK